MNKKMMIGFFVIAFVVTLLSVPVLANMDNHGNENGNNRTQMNDDSRIQHENRNDIRGDQRIQDNDDMDMLRTNAVGDDDANWEWIGLTGLLGLLGLRRRKEREA